METQTRFSRHNKFISADNIIAILPSRQMTLYILLSRRRIANVELQFVFRR